MSRTLIIVLIFIVRLSRNDFYLHLFTYSVSVRTVNSHSGNKLEGSDSSVCRRYSWPSNQHGSAFSFEIFWITFSLFWYGTNCPLLSYTLVLIKFISIKNWGEVSANQKRDDIWQIWEPLVYIVTFIGGPTGAVIYLFSPTHFLIMNQYWLN
jgi:hypothetical protein